MPREGGCNKAWRPQASHTPILRVGIALWFSQQPARQGWQRFTLGLNAKALQRQDQSIVARCSGPLRVSRRRGPFLATTRHAKTRDIGYVTSWRCGTLPYELAHLRMAGVNRKTTAHRERWKCFAQFARLKRWAPAAEVSFPAGAQRKGRVCSLTQSRSVSIVKMLGSGAVQLHADPGAVSLQCRMETCSFAVRQASPNSCRQ